MSLGVTWFKSYRIFNSRTHVTQKTLQLPNSMVRFLATILRGIPLLHRLLDDPFPFEIGPQYPAGDRGRRRAAVLAMLDHHRHRNFRFFIGGERHEQRMVPKLIGHPPLAV